MCPICMEEYTDDPNTVFIGKVKSCEHYFHFYCLWKWLEVNATCPMCRNCVQLTEKDIKGTSLSDIRDKMDKERKDSYAIKCHEHLQTDQIHNGLCHTDVREVSSEIQEQDSDVLEVDMDKNVSSPVTDIHSQVTEPQVTEISRGDMELGEGVIARFGPIPTIVIEEYLE